MANEQKIGSHSLGVARGIRPDYTPFRLLARNPDVDDAEDITPLGNFTAPTTLRLHAIVSSSTSDDAASTGARTIRVTGVGASYLVATEDVIMDGTTPVNTTKTYYAINSLEILTAGSGGTAAGNITATAATDATVSCSIRIGDKRSLYGVYFVPVNHNAYIKRWGAAVIAATAVNAEIRLNVKPFGGVNGCEDIITLNSLTSNSEVEHEFTYELKVTEKSWITLRNVTDTTDNAILNAWVDINLIVEG